MHINNLDKAILILLPGIGSFFSILFNLNLFFCSLIFFGLPILYLLKKNIPDTKKFFFLTLFTVGTFGLLIDYLATINGAWRVPSIFPFLLLGKVPIEDLIWAALYTFFIGLFYSYFFRRGKTFTQNVRSKYFILASLLSLTLSIAILLSYNDVIQIPYYYFFAGMFISFLPSLVFLFFHPKLITNFLITGAYFTYVSLLNELTALYLKHWSFPSNEYIGWVNILRLQFPFEELLFYIVTGSLAIVTYYLFFFVNPKELK